jgi:hypothetical protein
MILRGISYFNALEAKTLEPGKNKFTKAHKDETGIESLITRF